MTVDFTDLRLFVQVARQGSFSRAAANSKLSQPAVSLRLAAFEQEVGQPLFQRTKRGTTLTAAGELLLPYVERILQLTEEAQRVLREHSDTAHLRIAVPPLLSNQILRPLIVKLAGSDVAITCRTGHSNEVRRMVMDGVVDLGLLLAGAEHSGLKQEVIWNDPILPVCAASHHLAGPPTTMREIAAEPIAPFDFGVGFEDLNTRLDSAGRSQRGLRRIDSTTARELVLQNGFISWLPRLSVLNFLQRGQFKVLHGSDVPAYEWTVALLYRDQKRLLPQIMLFREVLLNLDFSSENGVSNPN